jgi:truncated hemoglobin YjbI
MTYRHDSTDDLDRIIELAAEAGLTIEEFLDQRWLRWHMLTLLAVVTGGPSKYQGRDLQEAHADLHITEEAFDRVAWHLQATLQELGVQPEDEQAILAEVRARRAAVVTFQESF